MGFILLGNIWKLVVDNPKSNGMSERRLGLKKKKGNYNEEVWSNP
jgi:hypothetical protein